MASSRSALISELLEPSRSGAPDRSSATRAMRLGLPDARPASPASARIPWAATGSLLQSRAFPRTSRISPRSSSLPFPSWSKVLRALSYSEAASSKAS